jgi:hypothetical protein
MEVLLATPCVRLFMLALLICTLGVLDVHANVTAVSLQSPDLSAIGTATLTSPIHVEATAEDTSVITGYVVYVDYQNVYRNFSPALDAWIAIPPGNHTLFVKTWDSNSNLATPVYQINITGSAPPLAPAYANRILNISQGTWTVDNVGVGGDCGDGSLGVFASTADPNTSNLPVFAGGYVGSNPVGGLTALSAGSTSLDRAGGAYGVVSATPPNGQHFILNSRCKYDDSLFYWKTHPDPSLLASATNFLWDFWFYVPVTTNAETVQALEFDLFHAVQLADGVHEFMFGTQCNYVENQWQFWLPQGSALTWVDSGLSPCRSSTGAWHRASYFLQRVTPSGYQQIPLSFTPSTDTNTSLRFGTLTIDGKTAYLGGVAWSTIPSPAWSPVLGVQHQLDSLVSGVTIEEYVTGESLTYW